MKKRESGITLLTLVITIIVMIILAGIALKSAIGENGIIGQTSNTINKYTNSSDQEQEGLNGFVDEFNEIINGGGTGDGGSGDEDITITDKPTISIADWNTTGGIVEISTKSEYTTQYRIGKTGSWEEYAGQVNVDNGDTIYARYSSDEGVGQTVSKIVEDTNGPEVTISNLTVKGNEITITTSAVDNEMGMPTPPTYNYYIKPHSEAYYESVGYNTTGEYTFTNLQENTSYDIKVSTTDIAGNQGSTTTNSQTGSAVEIPDLVPGSNIYFDLDPSGPTNGNVNVTIRVPGLEEPLYIEYSIDGTDNWTRYEKPVEMTNNGRVYARVTDGKETSNEVYADVTNIDRTKPDVSAEVQYPTGSDSITVVVTPNDPSDPDNNNFKYDYYIKEKGQGDDQYKKDEGTDKTHTFDELDQNKSYDIKVEVTDPAGNKTVIEIPGVTTGEVPSGIEDGNIEIIPTPTEPTNGSVTVTIKDNLNEGYDIEYSITKDGKEGEKQKYTGAFEVSDNCTVKAWFTDGTNAGDPATLEIDNIDKESPVASANPETDENKAKERNVTVTITDKGTAGFNTNQGINYKWTEENSGVPEGLSSLPGTNADKASTLSFTVPSGSNLTGTYYLYVGPVTDKARNSSEAKFFGPYEFDNEAPIPTFEPDGSTEYEKHYDVTLTFPEEDKEEVTKIEYEWTQGKDTNPTFQDGTTVEVGKTIPSPDGVTGDDWYLNVKVTDKNGNEETVKVGPFYIDNSGPNISSSEGDYTTPKKSHTVTVNVSDPNSGLKEDMLKYVWVNGGSTPTEDTLKGGTTFTTGQEITTPAGETGDNWHLWIYAEDKLGNVTKKDIGPFNLDNTAPTVTFSPDGNTSSWSKEYTVTVNPADANSNVKESTLKYQWTEGKTKPETISTTGTTFKSGEQIKSPAGKTGDDWYLWIYVEDNAGNSNIVGTTNPFYIDNTVPSLQLSLEEVSGAEAASTIKIQVNASDANSGINNSSYKYYIKEKGKEYSEASNVSVSGSILTFKNLKANTEYTIKVQVADNAGNTTYKEITITTGSVAGGDTVITHKIIPDSWINGSVSLQLSLVEGYDGYKIQYKLQSGTWTDYTDAIEITSNQTVQVRPLDTSNNPGAESSIEISNIDKVAPTISAKPNTDTTPAQTKKITLTATDTNTDSNIAGFNAGITIRYGWSTSESEEPTYNQTASSTNSAGAKTATFSITTPKYTGNYYLWIQAGSISDRASNSNSVAHFGPYTLDNQAPSITFTPNTNTTYAKSQSVTVNAGDAQVRKYVWTQSTSQPASSAFTGTFTNGGNITKNSGSGDWYLWVYVEDSLGNSSYKCSGVFKLDNTAPTITFGTNGNTTPKKVQSTTVNIADDGLSSINTSSLKYLWSTSSSGITESSFGSASTYTNGGSVSNSTLNGNYYLWVIAKDSAGNTTIKKTDNVFNFDNAIPTVTFTPNKNTTAAKSQSVKVSVSDTNLNTSSLKYVWTTTNSKPSASSITTSFTNNGSITINSGSGNRYLWILAYDTAGNELITNAGPFLVDNTAPTVSLSHTGTTSSIKVNVSATDDYSGIASYSYTIKQVGGSYTQTVTDGASHTFSDLTQGTKYTVTVTVKDGAGNTTTKSTEEITTGSIPSGTAALDISLVPTSWTNGAVTVTITKNVENADNLHIEYKIGTSGSYTTYDKSFTVSENTTIYAKLVDDAGNEGSAATTEIAYIDNQAPTIVANPTEQTEYKNNLLFSFTVTDTNYDSNIAGLKANQSIKYEFSNSNTTAPTSYSTFNLNNATGDKNISTDQTGIGMFNRTGIFYLWIQEGCIVDQAGNKNKESCFGPYYIDTKPPTLNGSITISSVTSKSISISVPGIKDETGTVTSPKYTYYIKKTSDTTYTQDGNETSTTTHTFNNLDDNTSYTIKVTFKDNAGNVGQATATKSTVLVPTLTSSNTTFTLSNTKWTNKPITVTISTTVSGYTLQYSTNGSTYQKYTGPITVSSNLTVYARLWDERNSTENVGTATTKAITNIDTSLSDLGVIVKNEEPVDGDTVTKDKNDNPITIPDGFTPQKDPDSSDPYNPTVDDGVIVKDGSGNEFVWIPVGTINTDSGTKTINYNRYTYANWVNGGTDSDTNSMKIKASSSSSEYFAESLNQSEKTSAETNHGFYLGRYEAGVSSGVRTESSGTSAKVEIKQGLDVYNYVTQSEARTLAENMATVEGYSGTTNLPSSYAWDTALKFLEQTGNTSYLTNSSQGNYYNTKYGGKNQTYASALIETGETQAVKHLYDMGGNVYEWTTERYSNSEATKVSRGGFYGFNSTDEPVIGRFSSSNTKDQAVGFRVALFLGTVNDQVRYMDDLKVGDYVAYTPGSETKSSYPLKASESGHSTDQTISKVDNLSWRVLSINDDGTVDLISSSLASTNTFYFRGALGYNNGVYLLNDIADELYSNDSLDATARSLTIEDIEKGMTEEGLNYVHSYSDGAVPYGQTKTYTGGYAYYPNLYAEENGSGINTTVTKTDGIGQSDSYYTSPTTETYSQASTEGLTVTQTYYNRSMSSSYYKNSTFYSLIHGVRGYQCLASRYVEAYSPDAYFGLRFVLSSELLCNYLFYSRSGTTNFNAYLRPVVSLKSNIKLGSGDGSSSSPYQIAE